MIGYWALFSCMAEGIMPQVACASCCTSCHGIGDGVVSCHGIGGGHAMVLVAVLHSAMALMAAVLCIALHIMLIDFSSCCSTTWAMAAIFALVPKRKKTSIATRCSGSFGGLQSCCHCVWQHCKVVTLCTAIKNDNQTGIVVQKLLAAGARSWWQWNCKWQCALDDAHCAMVAFLLW